MKFNIGDNVLHKSGRNLILLTIQKISKNGLFYLPETNSEINRRFENVITTKDQIKQIILSNNLKLNDFIGFYTYYDVYDQKNIVFTKVEVIEDLYDDIFHIYWEGDFGKRYKNKIENVKKLEDLENIYIWNSINRWNYILAKNADYAIDYILDISENAVFEK